MAGTNYIPIEHSWMNHEHVPIYEWAFPADPTEEDLMSFIRAREDWAKMVRYPVAWVAQLSNLTQATPRERKIFADHLRRFEWHDMRWNAGSAIIVPNSLLRGIVTAVFWMTPPKFPLETFSNREEGLAWARTQLKKKTTT